MELLRDDLGVCSLFYFVRFSKSISSQVLALQQTKCATVSDKKPKKRPLLDRGFRAACMHLVEGNSFRSTSWLRPETVLQHTGL